MWHVRFGSCQKRTSKPWWFWTWEPPGAASLKCCKENNLSSWSSQKFISTANLKNWTQHKISAADLDRESQQFIVTDIFNSLSQQILSTASLNRYSQQLNSRDNSQQLNSLDNLNRWSQQRNLTADPNRNPNSCIKEIRSTADVNSWTSFRRPFGISFAVIWTSGDILRSKWTPKKSWKMFWTLPDSRL